MKRKYNKKNKGTAIPLQKKQKLEKQTVLSRESRKFILKKSKNEDVSNKNKVKNSFLNNKAKTNNKKGNINVNDFNKNMLDMLKNPIKKQYIDRSFITPSKGTLYSLYGTVLYCKDFGKFHRFTIQVFNTKRTRKEILGIKEPKKHPLHKGGLFTQKEMLACSNNKILIPVNSRCLNDDDEENLDTLSIIKKKSLQIELSIGDGDIIELMAFDPKNNSNTKKVAPKIKELKIKRFDKVIFYHVKLVARYDSIFEISSSNIVANKLKVFERVSDLKVWDIKKEMTKIALNSMENTFKPYSSHSDLYRTNVVFSNVKNEFVNYCKNNQIEKRLSKIDLSMDGTKPMIVKDKKSNEDVEIFIYNLICYQSVGVTGGVDVRIIIGKNDVKMFGITDKEKFKNILSKNHPDFVAIIKPSIKKLDQHSQSYNKNGMDLSYSQFEKNQNNVMMIYMGSFCAGYVDMYSMIKNKGLELSNKSLFAYVKTNLKYKADEKDLNDASKITILNETNNSLYGSNGFNFGLIHLDETDQLDICPLINHEKWKCYLLGGSEKFGMDWVLEKCNSDEKTINYIEERFDDKEISVSLWFLKIQ